jgi:hypothetical protein
MGAIREQQSWRLVQYKRSKPVGHQHSAFRANGRLSVLASNSTAQVDDISPEMCISRDFDDQPFKPDSFVGKNRSSKLHPILETDH